MHLFGRTQWLLMGCLFLSAGGLMAQEYPNRVVRIVVADTPGSASDIAMRLLSQKLTEAWGQQVVADNRPGANGIIAAELVAKAKPDGYTLLSGVVSMLSMNQFVYKKLPYDSLRDFAPITQITTNHIFFTHLHYDHCADYATLLLTRWDQSAGKIPELKVYGPQHIKK